MSYYRIYINGHLDDRWLRWFDGLTVTLLDGGETLIGGVMIDQAALFGVLNRIRDLGMELISVQRTDPGDTTGRKMPSGFVGPVS